MRQAIVAWAVAPLVATLAMGLVARGDDTVRYNRDVRPILAGHCFKCHGPDEQAREAGLRFDRREAALAPAESGETPIVPGKPDDSELVRASFRPIPKRKCLRRPRISR